MDKLCIIHLFEADFNANNKWIGWAIMTHVESQQLLADEQYGSQKQRSAIVQCLNKCLWYDLICCTQTSAALCSNDAKSCYDRIVLLIAALCMCWLGASKSVVFNMIGTLHGMNHHIYHIQRFKELCKLGCLGEADCRDWPR